MASEFRVASVEQIAAAHKGAVAIGPFGSAMKASTYVDSGVPVIRGTNLVHGRGFRGEFKYVSEATADRLARSNVRAGDLVFPHRGAIGEVGIVPSDSVERWMLSTSLMKLTCDPAKAVPEFVFYFFRSRLGRHELLQYASTVGTPGIGQPLTSLKSCRLPLPPLDEQRRIAAVLGALDDKIELNRRMNQTLEEMAQAMFKSWFIDFDGIPDSEMVESEIGPIPKGWEVGTLKAVADLNPNSWTTKKHPPSVRYVDLSNTSLGRILDTTDYDWDDAPSRARRILQPWDTVFGCVRPGNRSYALVHDDGLTGSTGFAVLRARERSGQCFVYLAAIEETNVARLTRVADGAAYPAVRPNVVHETPCVIPAPAVLRNFDDTVRPLLTRTGANSAEAATLAALRDALLPKLISGEIRVPEAEEAVEAVL